MQANQQPTAAEAQQAAENQPDAAPKKAAKPKKAAPAAPEAAPEQPVYFEPQELRARIVVIGVGGAGGNAINNMIEQGLDGVEFVTANTDAQALTYSRAAHRLQLGAEITGGLGAGGRPEIGAQAAEESAEAIADIVTGAHMVFVASGMGGGTGTGAAPVVARIARECGALTVGVVSKPFSFEGPVKMRLAREGLTRLGEQVDAQIVIPNQNLYRVIDDDATFIDAFRTADEVLHQGVRSITDLMVNPGHINLDFADVRAIMQDMGPAIMGAGEAEGEGRAMAAAEAAIHNKLFDDISVSGARSVLVNVASDGRMSLREVDAAISRVQAEALEDAMIACGVSIDPHLGDRVRVSVVATGVSTAEAAQSAPPSTGYGAPRAPAAPVHTPIQQPIAPQAVAPQPAPTEPAPVPQPAAAPVEPEQAPRATHPRGPATPPPPSSPLRHMQPMQTTQPHSAAPAQPLGAAHVAPRRAAPAPAAPTRPATGAGLADGRDTGAALSSALSGEAVRPTSRRAAPSGPTTINAAPVERASIEQEATPIAAPTPRRAADVEQSKGDPMRVSIPDFLRRQVSS